MLSAVNKTATYLAANSLLWINFPLFRPTTKGFVSTVKFKADCMMSEDKHPRDSALDRRLLNTTNRLAEPDQFRFVTYNILGDLYASSEYSRTVLFPHCPAESLKIGYRQPLLLKEILGYHADIICLQEVDKKIYNRAYEPYLRLTGGYTGKFERKGTRISEGEATFFLNSRFELIDSHKVILSELIEPLKVPATPSAEQGETTKSDPIIAPSTHFILKDRSSEQAQELLSVFANIRTAVSANEQLRNRLLDRHTILQTTLVKSKKCPDRYVLIGNTHLYFAPDAGHVRLLQGSICVSYLEFIKAHFAKILEQKLGHKQASISVIFCGDLNSTPSDGIHRLVTEGKVPGNLKDWSSNEKEAVVGLELHTGLKFTSAYRDIPYTNYTPQFNGCLDWIYYEENSLVCESTVALPDHEDVTASGGLPSNVFPSDHLALVANMRFK